MESRSNSSGGSVRWRRFLDLVFVPVEFRRVGVLCSRTSDMGALGPACFELGATSRSSCCLDSVSPVAHGLAVAGCGGHCSIRRFCFDRRSDSDHLVFDCRHRLQRLYSRKRGRVNTSTGANGCRQRLVWDLSCIDASRSLSSSVGVEPPQSLSVVSGSTGCLRN